MARANEITLGPVVIIKESQESVSFSLGNEQHLVPYEFVHGYVRNKGQTWITVNRNWALSRGLLED